MTIKKEPDDNIYCHQAPGYTAKIVKTIPYSIHIEKNNQEQYFDYPKNLKSHNINRKQIGFMKSTGCLLSRRQRQMCIRDRSIKSDVLKPLSGNIFTFFL